MKLGSLRINAVLCRHLFALSVVSVCCCQSTTTVVEAETLRVRKLELADGNGAVVAELFRDGRQTGLRFYDNQAGKRRTIFEVIGDDRQPIGGDVSDEDRRSLKALGYDQLPSESRIRLFNDGGMCAELTADGINIIGNDGKIMICVSVDGPTSGESRVQVFDGSGKLLYTSSPGS